MLKQIIVKSRCALLTGEMTVVLRLLLDRVTVFINFNHAMFLRAEAPEHRLSLLVLVFICLSILHT